MHTPEHITFLQKLLVIPSFTPTDPTAPLNALRACTEVLDVLADHARRSGAHVIKRLPFHGGESRYSQKIDNLYVQWNGPQGGAPALCFLGHIDVVGNLVGEWQYPPFGAIQNDGYIYARGATDMKGAVAAFFMAMQLVSAKLGYSVCAVITSDEEWAAINGTRRVLHWMKENGIAPRSFLVGEPASINVLGDSVAYARRGSLNGMVKIEGISGHPAYPETFRNPYIEAAWVVSSLYALSFRQDSAEWRSFTELQVLDMVREGGDLNATASAVTVKWNIRYTDNYEAAELDKRMRDAAEDPARGVSVTSNLAYASKPYMGVRRNWADNPLAEILRTVVKEHTGQEAEWISQGGTSDGRFVQDVFPEAEVLEFGLLVTGGHPDGHPDAGKKGGMHQIDERLAIADYEELISIYAEVVSNYRSL